MTVGKDKMVTVILGRIGWVMFKKIAPHHFSDIRHTHRRTGVSGIGFLNGIHAQCTNRIGKVFTGHESLRGKVYSLTFDGKQVFQFALFNGEKENTFRQFLYSHLVLIIFPAEHHFRHRRGTVEYIEEVTRLRITGSSFSFSSLSRLGKMVR